jgi:glycosyltransferase involved in cell wall biosynthesis
VTHNRTQFLHAALNSLRSAREKAKSIFAFETIVVINGDDIETENFLRGHHADSVILQRTSALPGSARNEGLSASLGEWIYFADDDIEVQADLFQRFAEILNSKSAYDVIGGPNLTPKNSNSFQRASGMALSSPLASYRCADRYRRAEPESDCTDSKLILCNLFARRLLAVGSPFPNSYVCAEENFALSKWKTSGAKFAYDPSLSVQHHRRTDVAGFFRQMIK